MLGWCPPSSLQHRSSDKSYLPQSHEIVHFSAFDDEKPVLQPPHQIVIGFDVGADNSKNLLSQACESPRSVLEPHRFGSEARRPPLGSPRTPLSALGSLLADYTRIGGHSSKTKGFAVESHGYHAVLKSESDTYGAHRGHAFRTVDSGALSKHGRVRGPSYQQRDSQLHSCAHHEGHSNHHFTACLSGSEDIVIEDAEVGTPRSIFSPASPVSSHYASYHQSEDFLSKCIRCERRFGKGKDIYMYRGDQAFCSQECRYKQILADERKDRRS